MDVTFSLRQQDAADMVIAGLQSELEAYLRRPLESTEFVESHTIDSGYTGMPTSSFLSVGSTDYQNSDNSPVGAVSWSTPPQTIYLNNTPVISIEGVTVKPINGPIRTLVNEVDYQQLSYGIDYFYGYARDVVTITYTAGLIGGGIPMFKLMILRAATREMQNMHDDVVGLKDLTTREVAPLETGFMEKELSAVRRYRRVRI